MSRGLGKIERAILDDITIGGPSSVLIHSWGLLCHHNCFRRSAYWNFEPTTAERKAVTRAMRSFVRKFPHYALTGGKERKMLYLYEPTDPISAMWGKLSVELPFRDVQNGDKLPSAPITSSGAQHCSLTNPPYNAGV